MEVNAARRARGQVASPALSTEGSRRQHHNDRRQERQGAGQGSQGTAIHTEAARLQGRGQLARGKACTTHMALDAATRSEAGHGQVTTLTLNTAGGGGPSSTLPRPSAEASRVGSRPAGHGKLQHRHPGGEVSKGMGQPARGGLHYAHGVQRSSQENGRLWAKGVAGFYHGREPSSASPQSSSGASRVGLGLAGHG